MTLLKNKVLFIFFVLSIFSIFFQNQKAVASEQGSVNAIVKIGICGNNIVEGSEQCDGTDLNNKTCQDLGYSDGTLSCDNACDLVTTLCTGVYVSPSPIPVSTTTPVPTTSTNTGNNTVPPVNNLLRTVTGQFFIKLPAPILSYDFDNDKKIEKNEIYDAVKMWVNLWKKSNVTTGTALNCDINTDKKCDIRDFSVLLYYIER